MFIVKNLTINCVIERLGKDCKDAPRKPSFVRGHFRMINDKKVYIKSHYRKG